MEEYDVHHGLPWHPGCSPRASCCLAAWGRHSDSQLYRGQWTEIKQLVWGCLSVTDHDGELPLVTASHLRLKTDQLVQDGEGPTLPILLNCIDQRRKGHLKLYRELCPHDANNKTDSQSSIEESPHNKLDYLRIVL